MKVIIVGSRMYNQLVERIERIEKQIIAQQPVPDDKTLIDGDAVCRYLGISARTLQRLRSQHRISYLVLNRKIYYTLGDIKRDMQKLSVERRDK